MEHALGPLKRFAAVLTTWVLLNLAQPGLLRPDGFGHLAFFALAPWAYAASARPLVREGRSARAASARAFVAEWLAHALGLLGWFFWMRHLLPWLLVPMALVPALYLAAGGILLRRLAVRWPLALAAPMAYVAAELVRWHLPPPFSFGWLRTGELMHDTLWLSGSARVWGSIGLTYVLGALGGLGAEAWRRRGAPLPVSTWVLGVGPLVVGAALSFGLPAPPTAGSVSILIAQPGIEQSLKIGRSDYFNEELTPFVEEVQAGLRAAAASPVETGVGPTGAPDFVLGGESILFGRLVPDEVRAAFERGVRPPEWSSHANDSWRELNDLNLALRAVVALFCGPGAADVPAGSEADMRRVVEWLFGAPARPRASAPWLRATLAGERLLPAGTQFLAGLEAWDVVDGELRRRNALGLWNAAGRLVGTAPKVQLVPAAEGLDPVRYLPFAVEAMRQIGGYVPDFVAGERTTVFVTTRRDGTPLHIGATVCYDNAFDRPYTEPLRRGPVDLFVVASNEAWYGDSCEMDQLLAMARMRALVTGRPVVRATNSGISAVLGGDGRTLGVLEVDGRRKMVRGHLALDVPLPADPAARTFFVRTEGGQPWAWALVVLGLALARPRSREREARGSGAV